MIVAVRHFPEKIIGLYVIDTNSFVNHQYDALQHLSPRPGRRGNIAQRFIL
jgi:hypothetical protein